MENGVPGFFDTYKDTAYANGTVAKPGICCGTIEKPEKLCLENQVFPGFDSVLPRHRPGGQTASEHGEAVAAQVPDEIA